MQLRRVVTGVTEAGTSAIVEDGPAPETALEALAGVTFYRMWGTEGGASVLSSDNQPIPYWPGASGTRCVVIRFTPLPESTEAEEASGDALVEVERHLPGLTGAFEPGSPGFHTTPSIDYGVCLEGEMFLVVDGNEEVRITPGTCVVQRGTRHAWQHRSDRDAVMLFVLVGTEDVDRL
jgi:quercetin dioxygenase-like cupin family protein